MCLWVACRQLKCSLVVVVILLLAKWQISKTVPNCTVTSVDIMIQVTATLCAIVAAHAAVDDYRAACIHAERVLECLHDSMVNSDICSPYLVPVLQLMIRMSWKLGRDKRRYEAKLDALRHDNVDVDGAPSLMELVVNRFYR